LLLIFPFQSHSPSDPSIHYLQSSAFNLCPFQPGPLFFLSKPVAGSPAPDPSTDGAGEGSGAGEQPKVIGRQVGEGPWLAVVARLYRGQNDPPAGPGPDPATDLLIPPCCRSPKRTLCIPVSGSDSVSHGAILPMSLSGAAANSRTMA
jgi:hypothetical protein